MKKLIFILMVFSSFVGFSQNKNQLEILNRYITANNAGTDEAFHQFIKETYEPKLYSKINIPDHINFYKQIHQDFGELKSAVYERVEEEPLRLVVYLIKKDQNILNRNIDPTEVLVLKMDLVAANPNYMRRGLGLGALVCEKEKR